MTLPQGQRMSNISGGGARMYASAAAAARTQDRLVEEYAPLVKRIAYHMLARLPGSGEVEDLTQAGRVGPRAGARKCDDGRGARFEPSAGIRRRGAMLDDVRKGAWAPRSAHRNTRLVS